MIYVPVHVFNDPSEIILICWIGAQETVHIIINVEAFFLLNIIMEAMITTIQKCGVWKKRRN